MVRALVYPPADADTQWFADSHPGSIWDSLEKLVTHTTEGSGWPSYDGGAMAPGWTARPDTASRRLLWRQHFPANMSSRALVNAPGGVQTNLDRAAQVELVGTCIPTGPGIYWPKAPDWALQGLADFIGWLHTEWGLVLAAAPLWLPYADQSDRQRFTGPVWDAFRGICGHEHVPENQHKDPADLPIGRVLTMAGSGADMDLTELATWDVSGLVGLPPKQVNFQTAFARTYTATQSLVVAVKALQDRVDALQAGAPVLGDAQIPALAQAIAQHLPAGADPAAIARAVRAELATHLQ